MAIMNRRVVPDFPQKITSDGFFNSPDRETPAAPVFHSVATPTFESASEVARVSSQISGECNVLSP
jgi:hypothetical protein